MNKNIKETAINVDDESDFATYFVGQKKYINKLLKQAEQYPDDVQIKVVNSDGSIVATVPKKWFKAPTPPAKREMTEDQKMAVAKRLEKYRKSIEKQNR